MAIAFVVGTVTFDDLAVADEAILPAFSTVQCQVDGAKGIEVLILSLTAFDPSGHSEAFTSLVYRP